MNYKMINPILFVAGFLTFPVWGSDSTSLNQEVKLIPDHEVSIEVKTIRPIVNYLIETGSNSVPFEMMSRMVLGGYISPDRMESITNSLSENNMFMQKTIVVV